MKSLILFYLGIMISGTGLAQPGLLIAKTYHRELSPFAGNSKRDSTAYYYDKEGILRSEVGYFLPINGGGWQPERMKVMPETIFDTEEINYEFDHNTGQWIKWGKQIHDISADGNTTIYESYTWEKDNRAFFLSYKTVNQKIFSGAKLIRTIEGSCHNCSADNSNELIHYTNEYIYDVNDSLSVIEYYRNKPSEIMTGVDSFSYRPEVIMLIKTRTSYQVSGDTLDMTSREVERFDNGRLVSIRQYNHRFDPGWQSTFDSFAYDAEGRQIFYENSVFERGSPFRSRHRTYSTYYPGGLIETETYEGWNTVENSWSSGWKNQYYYTPAGNISSTSNFRWNNDTRAWEFQGAGYSRRNIHEQVTEEGYYDAASSDSVWERRYYYSTPHKRYKPFDPTLQVLISPNPARGGISATVYATDYYRINFTLHDAAGRRIVDKALDVIPGPNSIDLVPYNLRPGCYIYNVRAGSDAEPTAGKFIMIE